MSTHSGQVATATPSTGVSIWVLDAVTDEYADIVAVSAAGEVTAGAVVVGAVGRASGGVTPGSGDEQAHHPHGAASLIDFVTSMTTDPAAVAGSLIPLVFNANGGSIYIITDPNARPQIVGADQINCETSVGTSTSSWGVVWQEP